jgi:hypothetical protein
MDVNPRIVATVLYNSGDLEFFGLNYSTSLNSLLLYATILNKENSGKGRVNRGYF